MMSTNRSKYVLCLLFGLLAMVFAAPAFALSGAVWTTNSDCERVDQNQYLWLDDVFLQGGPQGNHSLDPGNYWVRVTTPSGVALGTSDSAIFVVGSDGHGVGCLNLWNNLK